MAMQGQPKSHGPSIHKQKICSRKTASLDPGGGFYSIFEIGFRNFEKTIDNPKIIL